MIQLPKNLDRNKRDSMSRNSSILKLDEESRITTIAWRMFLIVNFLGWTSQLIFWLLFRSDLSDPGSIIIACPYAFLIFTNLAVFFLANIAGRLGEQSRSKRILMYVVAPLSIWLFYSCL